jgi:Spy/CpxP family protein refolding chaperone
MKEAQMVLFGSDGKKARLIGSVLLIVTFIAGALAGAAVIRVVNAERPRAERREPGMRGGARRLLLDEQFTRQLGLTTEQRVQIKQILDRRDVEVKKLWQGFEPQLKAFGKQVHEDIAKVLTAEQQKKLDAEIEQRRSTWKKHRGCAKDSVKAQRTEN